MKRNPFSSPPLIGLDIQPNGIRLVQLKKTNSEYLLERILVHDLEDDIFAEGKIKHWDVLRSTLADLVSIHDLQGLTTAISLPANLVRMQQIQVPSGLSDANIEAEIYAHIQKDLPGITDALAYDFVESPQQKGYSQLFFVATRKEYLSQCVDCINAAGLRVKIVDVDIYALKRAVVCAARSLIRQSELNAIIYTVHDAACLIIFDAENIRFYQQWDMTETADFSAQLRSRIQIFLAMYQDARLHRFILCGNKKPDSIDDVHHLDLFAHINVSPSADAECIKTKPENFIVACGLAMREAPRW